MPASAICWLAALSCVGTSLLPLTPAAAKERPKPKPDPAAVAKAKQAIQDACDAENQGLEDKDADQAFSYHDADFEETSADGDTTDLDDERQSFSHALAAIQSITATATVEKVVLNREGTTVVVKEHNDMTLMNPATQQTARVATDEVDRQFWINGDDGWRLRRSRRLSGKALLNGKSMKERN